MTAPEEEILVDDRAGDFHRRSAGRIELLHGLLAWLTLVVVTGLGTLAGIAATGESIADLTDAEGLKVGLVAQSVASLLVLAAVAFAPPSIGFGSVYAGLRLALPGYVLFGVGWYAFLMLIYEPLWRALGLEAGMQPQLALFTADLSTAWLLVFAVAVIVIAPVFEEVVFRGYLYGGLAKLFGDRAATLGSATVFGLAHASTGLFAVFPLILIGCFFAWLRRRSGGLAAPILAHALHNGLTVAVVLMAPDLTDNLQPR